MKAPTIYVVYKLDQIVTPIAWFFDEDEADECVERMNTACHYKCHHCDAFKPGGTNE